MKQKTIVWIIVSIILIVVGCMLFAGVMARLNWDFTKLATSKYTETEYSISQNFRDITVLADTERITLVPSQDGKTKVVCHERDNIVHTVSVIDGTLAIETQDNRKWYEYIGIQFDSPNITVYLPAGTYGVFSSRSSTGDVDIPADFGFESIDIDVSTAAVKCLASATGALQIRSSTGNIQIENLSAASAELAVSTGKVTVTNVTCEGDLSVKVSTGKAIVKNVTCTNFISTGSTGDVTLSHVVAQEKLSVKRSTGDVKFDRCDASQIFVQTGTGDVTGSLLSDKLFLAQTTTGSVKVPKTAVGGHCEITTGTGDIKITVEK